MNLDKIRQQIKWIIEQIQCLKKHGCGGSSGPETDPTVPSYVKSISSTDITNWNNKLSAEADTLESVVNRGSITTQKITVDKLNITNPYDAQGDSTYTKQLVAKPNGDIGWENKSVAGAWVDFSLVSPATANKARYRVKGDTVELELDILRVNGIGTSQFAYIPTSIAPQGETYGIFVHGYNVSTSQPVMMRIGPNGALTIITNTNTDALVFTVQYKIF